MTKSELCLKCMKCCTFLTFEVPALGTTLEFYKARGVKIQLGITKRTMIVNIPHVCSKLTEKGCSIYKDRPEACKVFDGSTSITTKHLCLWNKENR
jgi:Fe-S-cluster containining protein